MNLFIKNNLNKCTEFAYLKNMYYKICLWLNKYLLYKVLKIVWVSYYVCNFDFIFWYLRTYV